MKQEKISERQYIFKNFAYVIGALICAAICAVAVQQSNKYGWDIMSFIVIAAFTFICVYLCIYKGIFMLYKEYKDDRYS